jgi:1-acyl-sn-glycerol-3-phosphate acyltransferase
LIKLGQRMKENTWSAVIFPEGTRSKTGEVKSFNTGGVAALLKKVPDALLVPIAIENGWKFVQYGSYPLSFGEHMKFTVLEPVEPKGKPVDEVVLEIEHLIREKVNGKLHLT